MPTEATPGGVSGDDELLRGIASGDAASLGAFYNRHSGTVLALCLRILGTRADAEEVLGDVFWQVWEQAGRYDPARGNAVPWLLILARSRAVDRLRAVGRRKRLLVESDRPEPAGLRADPPASSADPYKETVLSQQRTRIEAALARLDPAQRRAIELSFFEDLSHSEIAEILGEPLGTIKSRIRQGLIRLREGLQSQYGPGARA